MENTKKSATTLSAPRAFITKNKQRLKQNIDTVYLKNGDEFEIELFNPTENKVLAKIELNGDYLGNDIVVRPGERIFLERYLDEARKFTFKTYDVESDDPIIENAIRNNGDVIIKFYDEWKPNTIWNHYWTTSYTTYNPNIFGANATYTTNTNLAYHTDKQNTSNVLLDNTNLSNSGVKIETGRIERGTESEQTFIHDNSKFKLYSEWSYWWKILPKSLKHITSEDLKIFCTNCGAKRKKDNHKFCPHCGTQYK